MYTQYIGVCFVASLSGWESVAHFGSGGQGLLAGLSIQYLCNSCLLAFILLHSEEGRYHQYFTSCGWLAVFNGLGSIL